MKHQIIVTRNESGKIPTVAVVEVETELYMEKILPALINAITDWVNETTIGEERWEESQKDFNFGDLGLVCEEIAPRFLNHHGIDSLSVSVLDGHDLGWSFDTVLVDRNKVKSS